MTTTTHLVGKGWCYKPQKVNVSILDTKKKLIVRSLITESP